MKGQRIWSIYVKVKEIYETDLNNSRRRNGLKRRKKENFFIPDDDGREVC